MTLSIDGIHASGGFAGGPAKREVTWVTNSGEERTDLVYVRRLSYHSVMTDVISARSGKNSGAARIALCICDEEGRPLFSEHDITGIDAEGNPILFKNKETGEMEERGAFNESLTYALFDAISEVNSLGKRLKTSAKKKTSGTS